MTPPFVTDPSAAGLMLATRNPGKVREFREMLGNMVADLAGLDVPDVEETGVTFLRNACLKASGYARSTGRWTLADDSGLEVEALGGRPGVWSARFATLEGSHRQRDTGDAANNRRLLAELAELADASAGRRGARFRCVLAVANPTGHIVLTASGDVAGRIGDSPRGANGFGYDPLFVLPDGRTTAELEPSEKHAMSHRGLALRRLVSLIEGFDPPWCRGPMASSGREPTS